METIAGDLRQMQRTPLSVAHVEALRIADRNVHRIAEFASHT